METKYKQFLPVALLVLLCDQLSKWWLLEYFFKSNQSDKIPFHKWLTAYKTELEPFTSEVMTSFFNLVIVWNKGVSFGFLSTETDSGVSMLVIIALAIVGFFFYLLHTSHKPFQPFIFGLIIGGALGNILDRLRFDAVFDFLDFHYAGWHYPSFNVADSAITIGVILFMISEFWPHKKTNKFVKKVGRWHAK